MKKSIKNLFKAVFNLLKNAGLVNYSEKSRYNCREAKYQEKIIKKNRMRIDTEEINNTL